MGNRFGQRHGGGVGVTGSNMNVVDLGRYGTTTEIAKTAAFLLSEGT